MKQKIKNAAGQIGAALALTFFLIGVASTIALIVNFIDSSDQAELEKSIMKRLDSIEVSILSQINQVDFKIETLNESDQAAADIITSLHASVSTIISNQNTIRNEKIKNDQEIINASDTADWAWFYSRFPR